MTRSCSSCRSDLSAVRDADAATLAASYYWLHLLMDEARHTGQVILLREYLLPGADGGFDPSGGL